MDKSIVSMRDLFARLNNHEIDLKIPTFSQASKKRDTQVFQELITQLTIRLKKAKWKPEARVLFPIDSTIITLTSKLLWSQGYHQVKLFFGLNSLTTEVGGCGLVLDRDTNAALNILKLATEGHSECQAYGVGTPTLLGEKLVEQVLTLR
jgi:hypothetical protein